MTLIDFLKTVLSRKTRHYEILAPRRNGGYLIHTGSVSNHKEDE